MAFTFDVCELRSNRSMSYDGSGDMMRITWTTSYRVDVTSDDAVDPKYVSPVDVMAVSDLPRVNRSVYYFAGKIIPFVVCKNKTANQVPNRTDQWIVTCEYRSNDNSTANEDTLQEEDPPVAVTDITPLEEVVMNEVNVSMDEDYQAARYMLPSSEEYPNQLVERRPVFTLKITQYETFIPYSALIQRMLVCNEAVYRTQPRYTWFISYIEALETVVQLAGGPTEVAQVTYTLNFRDLIENGQSTGWKERRPLMSRYYREGGNIIPFADSELRTRTQGLITTTGARKANWDDPATLPDYVYFETQPTLDFSAFLQA